MTKHYNPLLNTIDDNENILAIPINGIIFSKWCTNCYPNETVARFTYKGSSLCENCFKKEKSHE